MYSRYKLFQKYITYYFTSDNAKGHGVHSPFVYDFITNVLRDKKEYPCYRKIEQIRKSMLRDNNTLEVEDMGAGSTVNKLSVRKIRSVASSSLKNKKFGQLLYRIVQHYKPARIIELGTSLGITSCYLAEGNPNAMIHTFEGSKDIAAIALNNFNTNRSENIKVVVGNFDDTLPAILPSFDSIDLAFIDGNHRKIPTLEYFNLLIGKATDDSIFIFDDIHWSFEMEEAWKEIQHHPGVTLSIDLFFIGIVFISNQFKAKQHFRIRF